MKILVVDDSKVMRMIVIRTLRQAGFSDATVIEAQNGVEGLGAVMGTEPDLILSDWNMPEMNGIDFLKALRARGDETPFGFVTSEAAQDMRDLAASSGADFLLAKPFNDETFGNAIKTVFVS